MQGHRHTYVWRRNSPRRATTAVLAGAVHGGGAVRAGGERVKVGRWGVWLTSVLDTVISDMVQ